MFPTIGDSSVYAAENVEYNLLMLPSLTIGDVIRKARRLRRWNQERLGKEAERYKIRGDEPKINKSTVSKVETDPYSSELGTVWRLVAALGLSLSEIEGEVSTPFAGRAKAPTKNASRVS